MKKAKTSKRLSLKAQWREIVALNFEVDRRILQDHVPVGTQLDSYNEHFYVTLMAKNIREVQPFGGRLTLFRSVDCVSLRFYIRREINGEMHRGYCNLRSFISTAWSARVMKYLFRQKFEHESIQRITNGFEDARSKVMPEADYRWSMGESSNHFKVKARSQVRKQMAGTKEEFFLSHHFLFVKTPKGTIEHAIRQAPWLVWDAASGSFDCDTYNLLGDSFRKYLSHRPSSVLLSRGGDISFARSLMFK